ncbi:hypothetical protein MTO96_014709 [Rhipicephalus appendiculatus]
MNTFAEKRFRLEARVARACLCFFASGSWHGNFQDYEVSFGSWYAVYVTLTATAMLVFEGFLIVRRFYSATLPGESSIFETLYTMLRLIVAVKVLVTFFIITLSTDTMIQALRAIKRLELSIGFHVRGEEGNGYFWFRRRARVAVYATLLLALAACRGVAVLEETRDMSNREAFLLSAISVIFSVYYGVIGTMAIRLEKYMCVVLSCYLKFQVDDTQHILFSARVTGETRHVVRAIERLRTSLAAVTTIVRKTDKRLRLAVVVNFLGSSIAACVVVHAAFDTRTTSAKLIFTALYAVFTTVAVVDASLTAGDIRTQGAEPQGAPRVGVDALILPESITTGGTAGHHYRRRSILLHGLWIFRRRPINVDFVRGCRYDLLAHPRAIWPQV